MKNLILAALIAVLTGSCAFVFVGSAGMAGAFAWSKGDLIRNYNQPLETAMEGVKHALGSLRLKIETQSRDDHYGKITARAEWSDDKIVIGLEKWTRTETRITVRVGALGDRERSEKIHDQIEKALR